MFIPELNYSEQFFSLKKAMDPKTRYGSSLDLFFGGDVTTIFRVSYGISSHVCKDCESFIT